MLTLLPPEFHRSLTTTVRSPVTTVRHLTTTTGCQVTFNRALTTTAKVRYLRRNLNHLLNSFLLFLSLSVFFSFIFFPLFFSFYLVSLFLKKYVVTHRSKKNNTETASVNFYKVK